MTNTEEKLNQIKLDRRKDEEIKALQKKYDCHVCQRQGANPTRGKCPHCGGDGIEPDKKEVYKRERKEIDERYAR